MDRRARRRLIAEGRRSRDPQTALRFHVIARLARGDSTRVVADALDLAPSTVGSVRKRYLGGGTCALYDRRRLNGRRKVTGEFVARVREVLRGIPIDFGWRRPTWTRELLCLQLVREGYERIAVCTMGRALATLGARLGNARPIVVCPWGRRRKQKRIAELDALRERSSQREPVFYADEVDIHLNPKIGRDWMLPGTQRLVVTPGKNQKRYLAGALHAQTRQLLCVEAESKNSDLFVELLRALARAYPAARRIHVIVDNFGIHTSLATRRALEELGRVVLHFLPPYTPEPNRIERVWQDLHANVTRNHRCRTLDELMRSVGLFINAYNERAIAAPSTRLAA
jgi:transposase